VEDLKSKKGYAQKYRQTVRRMELVLKKKRGAKVGRICTKRKVFMHGMKQ